ncbi:MAG: glycine cleavage system aminomethyltransferase GcvT [Marinifilaceae bacterium]|jgi:aminomethyltransferase|nr:glycine cleavage system aminomethyltransferase GcvT [Marinifilaceae bacterium]
MKTTAFTQYHIELGARMAEFAGYNMPIEYNTGIKDEHNCVREKLGVFDVSHMGEFWVEGPKAFEFVQKITTNNVADLTDGKVQYTCMPNGKGGIVDDLLVYRFREDKYLLVVNAANIDKDFAWASKYAEELGMEIGKELINVSEEWCQLAIQGPLALKAMQKMTDTTVEDMEYYTFKELSFGGIERVCFSTTGYTGSGGCEIYAKNEDADKLWKAVFEAGKEFGIQPIGLGARDTLRLEAGFCLYGNDIDDEHCPIEAGLGWITKFVDGNDFVDREYNEKMKAEKPTRWLKCIELLEKGIARHGYAIEDAEGNEIGVVTSGTVSPMTGKSIAMGYVNAPFHKRDTEVFIRIRKKTAKGKIVRSFM